MPERRLHPLLLPLLALVIVVGLIALFLATRNPDQDKLKDSDLSQSSAGPDPEKLCSAQSTYDQIKAALFQQAGQVHGGDPAFYQQLAHSAALRVEDPALESQDHGTGAINCSGSVSIELPPGFVAAGGAPVLTGDVDYTLQSDTPRNGVVLHNADGIITALAGLSQAAQPAAAEPSAPDANAAAPEALPVGQTPTQPPPQPTAQTQPSPSPPATRTAEARAGFDCATARSRGEIAVCSDAGLAALDRSMTAQYRRALSMAGPDEEALLRSTGRRFIAYRDGCATNACIGAAYQDRMREISDIMQGRWQPTR